MQKSSIKASSTKDATKSAPKADVDDKRRFTEKSIKEGLRQASKHHIESFDYAMKDCLPRICQNLLATEISSAVLE